MEITNALIHYKTALPNSAAGNHSGTKQRCNTPGLYFTVIYNLYHRLTISARISNGGTSLYMLTNFPARL